MPREGRRRPVQAYVIGVLTALIVLVLSFASKHVGGSATMFSGGRLHVAVAVGWLVCAGLLSLVVTRHLHMVADIDEGSWLAVGYDALPFLLLAAWIVMVAAAVTGHWLLAALCAALAV
ncbi:MAG TPA: hypothetical protein VGC84_02160, partial [Ilumatobacteraceae bacterium]